MKNKIVFAGSPDFAVESLQRLYDNPNNEIQLVISQEDKKRNRNKFSPTAVKKRAMELGIDVITPKNINDEEVFDLLDKLNPDFIVVVAYGQLIKKRILDRFKNKILNVHASILPKYRGASPINYSLLNGDKESGVSIMLVEQGLDTGDVLAVDKIELDNEIMLEELHDKLMIMGADLINKVIDDYQKYFDSRKEQNENEASIVGKIHKSMGQINFNEKSDVIYNKFRGLTPWPGLFFKLEDKIIKVHNINIIKQYNDNKNGEVVKVDKTGIKVACEDGFIIITRLQLPNKKPLNICEYLNGNSFEEGIIL
ncbi:methionyl-tRNA formyltransferase [Finegoldia magna]|uniref:methionyl-tRNA formyltransferase n=1 Tax=Finegoldia magna TaxID=1260 RepID=UPI000763D0AB|nr:methionyl-tRNA formyltransferase [Finegoldia magna]KXA08961.1 methionyl-tRNA formyltransferase [Finegoldia magna]